MPPPAIAETHEPATGWRGWLERWWRHWLIAAAVLVVVGAGLREAAAPWADVPSVADVAREIEGVYRPWLGGPGETAGRAGPLWAGAVKVALTKATGQWDLRVEALVALGVHAVAWAGVLALLVRGRRAGGAAGLVVATVAALAAASGVGEVMAPARLEGGLRLLLTAWHVYFVVTAAPGTRRWWCGQGLGLLNVLGGPAGLASPLAVLLGSPGGGRARADRWAGAALLGVGGAAALIRGGIVFSMPDGAAAVAVLGWPFGDGWGVAIVNLPLLLWVLRLARPAVHDERTAARQALFATAGVLALGTVLGGPTPGDGGAGFGVLLVVANLAAVADGVERQSKRERWRPMFAMVWVLIVAQMVLRHNAASVERAARVEERSPVPGAVRAQWAEAAGAQRRLAAVLPSTVRPALPAQLAAGAGPAVAGDFGAGALPGRPAGVAFWDVPTGGECVVRCAASALPLVQVAVVGELRPPAATLTVRLPDGREVAAFETAKRTGGWWKRIHFSVPVATPFALVARRASDGPALAFSAPVERSAASWLAGKAVGFWPWWLGLALVHLTVAVAAAVVAGRPGGEAAPEEAPLPAWAARAAPWLLWGLFACTLLDTTAGGSDSSGYLHGARMLLAGQVERLQPGVGAVALPPGAHVPLGFIATPGGQMVPTYPLGLPMMIAAVARVSSMEFAVAAVLVAHFLAGLLVTRQLARACGLAGDWERMAGLLVGASPLVVAIGLQPLSDGPSLVWVTAAVVAALRAREHTGWAVAAGLATTVAVFLRPTNLLCALPVACALGVSPRRWLAWIAGGVPGALGWMALNHRMFGECLTTGYGNLSYLFGADWFVPTVGNYARWLPMILTPLVVLAVPGLGWRGLAGRVRWVLAVWAAAFFGFYSWYECTHETWWSLRFVMPALPALAVAMLAAVRTWGEGRGLEASGGRWRVVIGGLLGLPLANLLFWSSQLPVLDGAARSRSYQDSARWAGVHLPGRAIVVAGQTSGALVYYTRLALVRFDGLAPVEAAAVFERLAATGRPVYALLHQANETPGGPQLPGRWTGLEAWGPIRLWRYDGAATERAGASRPATGGPVRD